MYLATRIQVSGITTFTSRLSWRGNSAVSPALTLLRGVTNS